jgi:hypothetical protein
LEEKDIMDEIKRKDQKIHFFILHEYNNPDLTNRTGIVFLSSLLKRDVGKLLTMHKEVIENFILKNKIWKINQKSQITLLHIRYR